MRGSLNRMRAGVIAAAMVTGIGLAVAAMPVSATAKTAPTCEEVTIPVSVAAGLPKNQRVAGTLCAVGPAAKRPVQLLVPGYTITKQYWDPEAGNGRYSWMRSATAAGYATLAIDRLGAGRSSKPASTSVSIPTHAWTIHQVVGNLRGGGLTGAKPSKIVLVGHSMGAASAQVEASTYRDVDAVVLLDWLHTPFWRGTPGVIVTSLPARLEKRFAHAPVDYLTAVKGAHEQLFFHRGANADPAMIAYDERTKTYGTLTEEVTILPTMLPTVTRGIRVPVFLGTGQYDSIFCGPLTPCPDAKTVKAREAVNFTAPLTTYVLPNAGHNASLHRNAPSLFAAAQAWIAKH